METNLGDGTRKLMDLLTENQLRRALARAKTELMRGMLMNALNARMTAMVA